MNETILSPLQRFLATLDIVHREARHLAWSHRRLFAQQIDLAWVDSLDTYPERAEQLEAFISRFGRLQDTIGDKLLPRWLLALAERPASQIESLNRAERLGVIESVDLWLEARQLRNRLVHEYMADSSDFLANLTLADSYSSMLLRTYENFRRDTVARIGVALNELPPSLDTSSN
ncbi:hypothetical protein [Methylococcus mesophilus]|uniref:hypothetical protein n=1 Tax=Methylococcus mesophilus TaxID=2993564 RepID=UPI00224A96AE|nr:hypothetical protein [Methylococcus mesophilus]UZR29313.1 hypothetical protein OOT43_01395 [Methylococcus mesophilus]